MQRGRPAGTPVLAAASAAQSATLALR